MSFDWPTALPLIFAGLMGLAILIYVILDGFDLGIGILFSVAEDAEQDTMIAAIGPFWDANETWLVLAVGLLLVAFPMAHGVILTALYIPVFVLLVGLILRGVAFDFRAKVPAGKKHRWNRIFFLGSIIASLAQGYMLGVYVLGLDVGLGGMAFGALVALCLSAAYAAMGAAWVIYKTEGELQKKAVAWLRTALVLTALGMAAVSLATPFASPRIFAKWFVWPRNALSVAAADPVGAAVPVAVAADLPSAQARRPPCPDAVPDAGRHLRARLCRAGLVVLPVRRARQADHLAGGVGDGKPRHHPGRHGRRAAGHHLLFLLCVSRVWREGDGFDV